MLNSTGCSNRNLSDRSISLPIASANAQLYQHILPSPNSTTKRITATRETVDYFPTPHSTVNDLPRPTPRQDTPLQSFHKRSIEQSYPELKIHHNHMGH